MKESWAEICAYIGPRLMHDFGLQVVHAGGVLGNSGTESGGGRWMQEIGKGSRGGLGLQQWTGPRRRAFEAWCAHHGVSTASLEGNYGYLKFELSGAYAHCVTKLKQCKTLEASTISFCNSFEKPSKPNMQDRIRWARSAVAAFSPGHPTAVAPAPKRTAPMAKKARPVARRHTGHHHG